MTPEKIAKKIGNDFPAYCNYLEYSRFVSVHHDWVYWLFSPNEQKTFRQLLAHRESWKTTVLSVGVSWFLLFHPNHRIGIVRSNKEEGKMFLKMVKGIMEGQKYRYILSVLGIVAMNYNTPLFSVDNADSLVLAHRTENYKEGTLDAIGYEQSVTGRHYDILLFDDFVTIADRLSPVIRRKKSIYANEFVHNILTKDGLAINLGTFWHKEDSNQRLKEAYSGDKELIFDEKVFPIGTVFREKEKEIQAFRESKIKGLGQSLYSANYELIDKQDENLPFGNMQNDFFRADHVVYAVIDPAYGGGDRTAVSIGTRLNSNFMIVGKIYKESIYNLIDKLAVLLAEYQVSRFWVEVNADKGASLSQLNNVVSCEGIGYTSTSNKQYRIMSNLKPRWGSIYFDFDRSDSEYLVEVQDWNELSSRDDAPDSLSILLEKLDFDNQEEVNYGDYIG